MTCYIPSTRVCTDSSQSGLYTHHSSCDWTANGLCVQSATVIFHSPFGSDKGQQVNWAGSYEGSSKALYTVRFRTAHSNQERQHLPPASP